MKAAAAGRLEPERPLAFSSPLPSTTMTAAHTRFSTSSSITSQEILDENASRHNRRRNRKRFHPQPHSSSQAPMVSRKVLGFLVIGVLAIAGVIIAIVVTHKAKASSSASAQSGGNSNDNKRDSSTTTTSKPTFRPNGGGGSSTSSGTSGNGNGNGTRGSGSTGGEGNAKVTTDPATETFALTTFAIGDWGSTAVAEGGSCCSRRKGVFTGYDRHAEAGVNKLMALEAATNKPAVVIGHGDSFYWSGIDGDKDQSYRFQLTFEERHGDPAMRDVPWVNVVGNHDYGGASYVCVSSSGEHVACNSAEELVAALKKKFTLQSTYKSPNNNRWILKDHFYTYSVEKGDVTMDIFNLDTNDAESHAADQICCQCYGYANGDNDKICNTVSRGHKLCCGGDTAMYDACMKQFKAWGDDSRDKLLEGVKASKATWKIVNTHYSPYGHFGPARGKKWLEDLEALGGVQVWIAGHTHGEKHDYGSFGTHFIENGAGGGIQSESASGIPPYATNVANVWTAGGLDGANTYGFFTLQASANWLKVRFMTFDDKWSMDKTADAPTTVGGVAAKHCWYIPRDGGKGRSCSE